MNVFRIFAWAFLALVFFAPASFADKGPRSTDVRIESSEQDLFGSSKEKEDKDEIVFYRDGATSVAANGDGAGLRNVF